MMNVREQPAASQFWRKLQIIYITLPDALMSNTPSEPAEADRIWCRCKCNLKVTMFKSEELECCKTAFRPAD